MINELTLSEEIKHAGNAKELMRIWMTDEQQTVLFDDTVWEDPAAWGILVVDLMRHLANAYAHEGAYDFESAFARIKVGIEAEMSSRTS